jgi:hypothetical protein
MSKRARIRAGGILLVLVAVVLSVWFFSSDLKIQLFDLPTLEAQKQSIVGIISMTSANDQLLGEDHYPIRKTLFCFWGYDTWTYKSSQTWSGIVHAFDQSFDGWGKRPYPSILQKTGTFYYPRSGPFYVELEDGDAANTYIVRLFTNDPATPHCGPD